MTWQRARADFVEKASSRFSKFYNERMEESFAIELDNVGREKKENEIIEKENGASEILETKYNFNSISERSIHIDFRIERV